MALQQISEKTAADNPCFLSHTDSFIQGASTSRLFHMLQILRDTLVEIILMEYLG